jgi:serine/threonine protein kinase
MAPEVLLGAPHSPAADVFALASTLAELGTGRVRVRARVILG